MRAQASLIVLAFPVFAQAAIEVACGGLDDQPAIQAALNAGGGQEVHLSGSCKLWSTGLVVLSGTVLSGKARLQAPTDRRLAGPMISVTGATGVTIRDLELDGGANDTGAYGALYGIAVSGGSGHTIERTYVHGTAQAGIWADSSYNLLIVGNRIDDCGRFATDDHGIMVGTKTVALSGVSIIGNTVTRSHRKSIAIYAFGVGTISDVVIASNIVNGGGLGGIYVSCGATGSGFAITGNQCHGNSVGIEIINIRSSTVVGNTATGNTGNHGVYVSAAVDTVISGNTVDLTQIHGITVDEGKGPSSGLVISSNTIARVNQSSTGYGAGIVLSTASNSQIVGNSVSDTTGKMVWGILEGGTSDANYFGRNLLRNYTAGDHYLVGPASAVERVPASSPVRSLGVGVSTNPKPNAAVQHLSGDGRVLLAGDLLAASTVPAGAVLATLEPAFRPDRLVRLPVTTSANYVTHCVIQPNGQLTLGRALKAGVEFLPLNAIQYKRTN